MSKVDLGQGYQGEPVDMKATGATGAYEKLSRNDFSGAEYGKPLSPDIQNDPTPENMVGTTQHGGTVYEDKASNQVSDEGSFIGFIIIIFCIYLVWKFFIWLFKAVSRVFEGADKSVAGREESFSENEHESFSESMGPHDRSSSVRLAMSIAMADGSLDDSEGNVIKEWIIKTIAPHSNKKREQLKKLHNYAMREAYAEAKSGNLEINSAVDRLNEIADTPQKYEAIELCFEVMAADGAVDENEIKTIKSIAEGLDLDSDEIERLRDEHLINLNVSFSISSVSSSI